ncbi:MAG: right-handed parallel beta-helix repeat-containing protein, partial [Desulfurellales bacterium]
MATLNATPSTISSVVSGASAGDTIVLAAGTYASPPRKSGLIYQAHDWKQNMVLTGDTGHLGKGMTVIFTGQFDINVSNITFRGIFHDTRGYSGINAGVFTGNNIVWEDCSGAHRPTSGARQIGYTFGAGTTRVTGIKFLRCRAYPTGQQGQKLDHAFYLKNCTDCLIEDTIIYDGGRFPLHLYTNADNNVFRRCVIWDSVGCVTFSGASDSSTGTSTYGTSDNNLMTGCIIGQAQIDMVGNWTSDSSRPVSGNVVEKTMMWKGTGAAPYPGAMKGVTFTNNVQKDPGFKNAKAGDFTRSVAYDGYGPEALCGTVTPPP